MLFESYFDRKAYQMYQLFHLQIGANETTDHPIIGIGYRSGMACILKPR